MIILIQGNDPRTLYVQQDPASRGAAHWIGKKGGTWREATNDDLVSHGNSLGESGVADSHAWSAFKTGDAAKAALVAQGFATGVRSPGNPVNVERALRDSIMKKLTGAAALTDQEAAYLKKRL